MNKFNRWYKCLIIDYNIDLAKNIDLRNDDIAFSIPRF